MRRRSATTFDGSGGGSGGGCGGDNIGDIGDNAAKELLRPRLNFLLVALMHSAHRLTSNSADFRPPAGELPDSWKDSPATGLS